MTARWASPWMSTSCPNDRGFNTRRQPLTECRRVNICTTLPNKCILTSAILQKLVGKYWHICKNGIFLHLQSQYPVLWFYLKYLNKCLVSLYLFGKTTQTIQVLYAWPYRVRAAIMLIITDKIVDKLTHRNNTVLMTYWHDVSFSFELANINILVKNPVSVCFSQDGNLCFGDFWVCFCGHSSGCQTLWQRVKQRWLVRRFGAFWLWFLSVDCRNLQWTFCAPTEKQWHSWATSVVSCTVPSCWLIYLETCCSWTRCLWFWLNSDLTCETLST